MLFRRPKPVARPLDFEGPAKPGPIDIDPMLSAWALRGSQKPTLPETLPDVFRAAQPMPGTVPEGYETDARMAMDDACSPFVSYASPYGLPGLTGFLGYPVLATLAQQPEYRNISETMAKELTRRWIKLTSSGDDDKTDKLNKLSAAMDRFKLRAAFQESAEHDGLFGRGQIYIDTGSTDDKDTLALPLVLSPATIKKGDLKGFRPVEPYWIYPNGYQTSDPLSPDHFKPKTWFVQGREVHRSRLLMFISREVPDMLKPAYAFGGLSLTQLAQSYVNNFLRNRQSVSDLLHSFSIIILSTDMSQVMDAAGAKALMNRLQFFIATRDNKGVYAIAKEIEELTNIAVPLAGLHELLNQSLEQICIPSHLPLVKYTGVTPSGLNASGEGEIRVFYDFVASVQEMMFRPNLEHALKILQLNEFGEIDPEIGFEFLPLWQMDEAAKASIEKTKCDVDVEYINAGVLAPEEVRDRLANDDASGYVGIAAGDVPEPPETEEPDLLSDPARSAEPRAVERSGV